MRLSERPSGVVPSDFYRRRDRYRGLETLESPAAAVTANLIEPFPPLDQGDVRCCVSIAITTAMELLDHVNGPALPLSPLYHYYVTRPDPTQMLDLDFESGLLTASVSGIARLSLHHPQMTPAGAAETPTGTAYADGSNQRLGSGSGVSRFGYRRVYSGDELKDWRQAVLDNQPIVVAFWLSHAYDGISPANPVHGTNLTGAGINAHAVVVVGFSDAGSCFRIRDSRGPAFGKVGHWLLPYSMITPALIVESWAITNITY